MWLPGEHPQSILTLSGLTDFEAVGQLACQKAMQFRNTRQPIYFAKCGCKAGVMWL